MIKDRFKFRAWNKETKTMHYEAEQTYDCMTGTPFIYKSSFGDVLDDENYVVEQCAGLKDKNGELIFEGDVVEYDDEMFSVFYSQSTLQFGIMGEDFSIYGDKIKKKDIYVLDVKIVGNIHENPELLK